MMIPREQLERLQPHDGNFGMAAWVHCIAPCCGELHHGQGWFAIKSGEAHYVDPVMHQHVHADCYLEMRERLDAQKAANDAIYQKAITGWFRKTGTE